MFPPFYRLPNPFFVLQNNIVIADDGTPKLIDISYGASMNGDRIVDWQHVPPQELINGATALPNAAQDVYSFGTTMFKVI